MSRHHGMDNYACQTNSHRRMAFESSIQGATLS